MASFGWKRKIGERVSKVTSQNFEKESANEAAAVERDDVDWLHSIKRKKGLLLEDNISESKRLKDEGALLALSGRSCVICADDFILHPSKDECLLSQVEDGVIGACVVVTCAAGEQTECSSIIADHGKELSVVSESIQCHLLDSNPNIAQPCKCRHQEAIKKWDEGINLTPEDAALYEMKAQSLLCLQEMFPAVQAAEIAVSRNPKFVDGWQTLGRAQLGIGEIAMAIRSFQIGIHICPSNVELWEEDLNWACKLLRQKREAEAVEALESKQADFSIEQSLIPDYDFESDEVVAACDAISQIQKVAAAGGKTIVVSSSGKVTNQEPTRDKASTSGDQTFIKAR